MTNANDLISAQAKRNQDLLASSTYMRERVESSVLPFRIDLGAESLDDTTANQLSALEKDAAAIALASLASLATINELDHLGGGLGLIPPLMLSLGIADYEARHYTIEHAHASIGYYASLAALGFLDRQLVIDGFRRGLDIAGHVSWVPGGTQLNGGRLGVMIPVAVGQALGLRAHHGEDALVVCHTGDAGWVSGQALNGFIGASVHEAPMLFVMDRNGIQLSDTCDRIMPRDPRATIEACGVTIVECPSLNCPASAFKAYREGVALAKAGKPALIYPTGGDMTLTRFGELFGIDEEVAAFAAEHGVDPAREVWCPGSLMSYRDVEPMLECLFHVNHLPGGEGHHDGHMKGRDLDEVLANPLLAKSEAEQAALDALAAAAPRKVVTEARPAVGSEQLVLPADAIDAVNLPEAGAKTSPRAGVQVGYEAVAKAFPESFFTVSCDLDPSTKLDKAKAAIADDHKFEMSITEQVSALMANGLACAAGDKPQVNVFATFAAFFEGIAREALELWRYQRNLNGVNEGLNTTMHLSHVGACTGRDHFSGWALDWITLAMGYLPYIDRFYAPCDARSAFVAVKDLAGRYGASIIGIPRDNLPVLTADGRDDALFNPGDAWEPVTAFRSSDGARKAILALGAPAYLAEAAIAAADEPVDAYVVNGLPCGEGELAGLLDKYSDGVVTIEDGIIATPAEGLRGFASMVQSLAVGTGTPTAHVGITDPQVAPSEGHDEVWEHFGLTSEALVEAIKSL